MASPRLLIAVGRLIDEPRIIGRTPDEMRILINTIREFPDEWFLYSIHLNMASAHVRASQLRGPKMPLVMIEHKDHLDFRARRTDEHGPCVLVRWVQP